MIKKIIFFIIISIIALPLFSKTSVVRSFDEENDEINRFERKLVRYLNNLGYDEKISFLSYSNSILTLNLFDKEYRVPIVKGKSQEALDSILLYNEHFDSNSEEKIDYFYEKTFSSKAELKRGSLYYALNKDGKKQALFLVDKTTPASTLLPLYSKQLVTLLELKKTSPYVVNLSMGFIFYPKLIINGDIKIKNQTIFYPINPSLKFKVVSNANGITSYLGGLGLSAILPLSTFYPRSIALIRNTTLGADCYFYIGYNSKIVYAAGWELYLYNMLNEHFGLSIGVEKTLAFKQGSKNLLLENTQLKVGVVVR